VPTVTPTTFTTPWPHWVQKVVTATSVTIVDMPTIMSGASIIWTNWCEHTVGTTGTITATGTCDTSVIWANWADTHVHIMDSYTAGNTIRQPTEAEVQQRLRDREAADQRRLQVEGEKAVARDRATVLLQGHLDAAQRHDLANKGFFDLDVLSQDGSRKKYRINRKWSQNIQQIDPNGRVLKTLCIHPRVQVPVEDSMLTQKLMLESGLEQELLRIANHS